MRLTILALLTAAAAPALAQTPPGDPPPVRASGLLRADANGDGIVTRAEATAAADARFDRADADRDGTVTIEEMRAERAAMRGRSADDGRSVPPPPPPPPRDTADNGDRRPPMQPMTREQWRARALAAFDRADANHDGAVDAAERARLRDMRPRGPRPGGDAPPPPPQG